MRSFLLKDKKPVCLWGSLPPETYFIGDLPTGYSLAVNPSKNYIVLDIDRHGNINGFNNIPQELSMEIYSKHFGYPTKNNGRHVWMLYSGDKILANKTSGQGIDLRTSKGYVVWYPQENIKDCLKLIKETSPQLNNWLESLFSFVNK